MQKREFKDIFQSYFHNKYSLEDFYSTKPKDKLNVKLIKRDKQFSFSYIKESQNSMKLKNYHTFLTNILFNNLKVSDNVYSYKKNTTILQMLDVHKYSKYYFKTDIKGFFHHITKSMIMKCISQNIEDLPIDNLDDRTIETILDIVTYNDTLAVGFSSSPSISNAILYEFDLEIHEYCEQNNIVYSRYSDDLLFSSDIQLHILEKIIEDLLGKIYESNFEVNKDKSKYFDKTKRIRILGLIITPDNHITVPRKRKDNMKKLLHFFTTNTEKFTDFLAKDYNNSLAKAYGELNYINDIDADFMVFLRRKYGNYVVDKFLHGDKQSG